MPGSVVRGRRRPLPGELPPRWWAACRPLDGNRLLLALLHLDKEHERRNPLLRILLGHPAPTNGWPFPGTDVLVLDDERFLRNFYVSLLEQVGCVCYRTDEPELALRLFAGSPRLKVVLMDHDMPGIGPADRARLVRPVCRRFAPAFASSATAARIAARSSPPSGCRCS